MNRFDLQDFSGGLSEQFAADGFTNRQWSKLKGFIIDSDYTIRSQWAGQSVGTNITPGVKAVSGFTGSSNSYLVAIDNDGYLWWAIAPAESANYTTTNAVSWTKLTSVALNLDYRFICEILLTVTSLGEVNALLINSESGSTPPIAIFENDSTSTIDYKVWDTFYPLDQPNLIDPFEGETKSTTSAESYTATTSFTAFPTYNTITDPWTVANDGLYPVEVRINSGSTITTIRPKDSYTHTVGLTAGQTVQVRAIGGSSLCRIGKLLGSYPLARRNIMPRGNVGTMWRNRLILADTQKRINTTAAWGSGNIQRAPYAFYYSEAAPDSFYGQALLFAGSGESQIIGMHVLDDYLITISSPSTESDGLRIFKGQLDYLQLQAGTTYYININVLRGGIGPTRDTTTARNRIASCIWSEAGIVAFLDNLGGVWYTDGVEVDRLDRTGPTAPDITTVNDEISALSKYLFVQRNGRLLLLNILSGVKGQTASAAWTELVLPSGYTAKSFAPVGGSMYFVMNNKVYRFAMSRNNAADTERGAFDNTQVDLTVATPTLADTNQHQKLDWFRFGMRSRKRSSNSQVRTVTVKAGPALDTNSLTGYTKALNRNLDERDEFVVPAGIGKSVEASGEVTFRGDLQLESATFWTSGNLASRPGDGSDS